MPKPKQQRAVVLKQRARSEASPTKPTFTPRPHNLEVSDLLERLAIETTDTNEQIRLKRTANRVADCGRLDPFRIEEAGRTYCRYAQLCLSCRHQDGLKYAELDCLNVWIVAKRDPKLRFLMITVGVRMGGDLRALVDSLYADLERVRRRQKSAWSQVDGSVSRLELERCGREWRPHLHMIVAVKGPPAASGLALIEEWARITGPATEDRDVREGMIAQHAQAFISDGTSNRTEESGRRLIAYDAYRISRYSMKEWSHVPLDHVESHERLLGLRRRRSSGVFLSIEESDQDEARRELGFPPRKQVHNRLELVRRLVPKIEGGVPEGLRRLFWINGVKSAVLLGPLPRDPAGRRSRKPKHESRVRSSTSTSRRTNELTSPTRRSIDSVSPTVGKAVVRRTASIKVPVLKKPTKRTEKAVARHRSIATSNTTCAVPLPTVHSRVVRKVRPQSR